MLAVAARHLARHGYEAMSLAAIRPRGGHDAPGAVPALAGQASLAADALLAAAEARTEGRLGQPARRPGGRAGRLRRGVSRLGGLAAGVILQDGTAAGPGPATRPGVVAPRRARIRAILERAARLGLIDPGADLEVAVSLGTGSWYALALAGQVPPADWPDRAAALVWRSVGGTLPPGQPAVE